MKITIHRGANEIGGTCIELKSHQTSIFIDMGEPLSKESRAIDFSKIKRPDAVIVSHPHQDHFGLIETMEPDVPIYIGEVGKCLIDSTRCFIGKPLHANCFHHFKRNEPIIIGDFKITPYLVDHSAVDAYAFLIEAEGKRLFYSGDFRAHGRKSVLFDNIISNPPENIDLLFMEGTMMQRSNDDFPTEADVEQKIFETIKEQENITFLIASSQNIDRIVSAFRACKKASKTLVIDIYTAWVLEQLKLVSNSVPAMDWDGVRVYASFSHNMKLSQNPEFFGDFQRRVYNYRIRKEELQASPSDYLFFSKMSHFKIIDLYKQDNPVNVIYSQWLGYLSAPDAGCYGAVQMADYQNDPKVNFVYAHTSGHATVKDLQIFAEALKPKMLVPVHTEHGADFGKLFDKVTEIEDGVEFEIN